jgi:hypothetical protein
LAYEFNIFKGGGGVILWFKFFIGPAHQQIMVIAQVLKRENNDNDMA